MNTIDFSELPHKKHNGKSVVDWKKLNGEKIYFEFEGINDCFTIYFSHTVGKYGHRLRCIYNNKEKLYTPQALKEIKINSLVDAFSSPLSKPTPENWLYQRTDLHKFVDNPEDLKTTTWAQVRHTNGNVLHVENVLIKEYWMLRNRECHVTCVRLVFLKMKDLFLLY